MDMIATILFGVLVTYVVIGLLAGLAFVVVGVARVQPAPVTIGARILCCPARRRCGRWCWHAGSPLDVLHKAIAK